MFVMLDLRIHSVSVSLYITFLSSKKIWTVYMLCMHEFEDLVGIAF